MRAPISLEDRTLLTEEPFLSAFLRRRRNPKKVRLNDFIRKTSIKVENASGGLRAVEEWISLAFEPNVQEAERYSLRSPQEPKRLGRKAVLLFVKFFWRLFSNQDAITFLLSQKLPGYTRKFDHYSAYKFDPFGSMSPLTVLSDDTEDVPPFPELDPVFPAMENAIKSDPAQGESDSSSAMTVDRVPQQCLELSHPMLELPHNLATPPSSSVNVLLSTVDVTMSDQPGYELESLNDPILEDTPQGPAQFIPHLSEDRTTSQSFCPADALGVHPTDDIILEGTLQEPVQFAPHLSETRATFQPFIANDALGLHPTDDSVITLQERAQFVLHLPENRATSQLFLADDVLGIHPSDGIKVKLDPSENESDFLDSLRLLDPADIQDNLLSRSTQETEFRNDKVEPEHEPHPVSVPPRYSTKRPLKELPPIWAQSRQEVCESFDWFRSYQGGVYQNGGFVRGYFLSAFSANRDGFYQDGKIIISHGGGKAESVKIRNGRITTKAPADDQREQDISVRALIKNYNESRPLVLLIDDKYEPFPFDLGSRDVYMAVLGFYRIIHVWAEYQPSTSSASGRVVRYKFAFQWCEDQGRPWWIDVCDSGNISLPIVPVTEPTLTDKRPSKPTGLYFLCPTCRNDSPYVYQTWMCLNPQCTLFWIPPSGSSLPAQLEYNSEFLKLIDNRPLPINYRGTLEPKPPVLTPENGVTTTYAYSRGWHCRRCGRLSCRSAWEIYQCPNCKDTHSIIGRVRQAKHFKSIRVDVKFADSSINALSAIARFPTKFYEHFNLNGSTGNFQTFLLPEGRGKIHHIKADRTTGNVEADRIFEAYQQQASDGSLLFRRWPLRQHKLRGPLLTNYFSQNSGETYHYVGGTDNTVPFDRAPGAVVQARQLIEKRIHEALRVQYVFNEVLSAAYMEQQKMAFHSDSERGLGGIVAGLSLGSPALMHFRLLSKFVPPSEPRTTAMTVVLRHGDVLVMEGAGIQECYEHTVVPCGFRIAATARWIDPGHK
ncbi:hypothetical protein B0H10DRAFT_806878 [Mycena sp. CBHHK59/15]|nr:hypothetical protein B0H10DRAFT_806878 [Mycena sp. CBHHK59/15]